MNKLSQLGELGIIDKFYQRFSKGMPKVNLGIGDDAAALELPEGYLLLMTTDIMVEGIHFKREYTPPLLLGRKSLAINLSDIAAMGGEPLYFLLTICFTKDVEKDFLEAYIDGLHEEAKRYNVNLIGGDTSSSEKHIILSLTLIGQVKGEELLTRSNAKPGDFLYVSGDLGRSAAGLPLLQAGYRLIDNKVKKEGLRISKKEENYAKQCMMAHLSPSPRLELGRLLAANGFAHAVIDLSDGLSRDLNHICHLSKCGAIVQKEALPIAEATRYWAEKIMLSPYDLALDGGEDYELLITVPPEKAADLENLIKKENLTPITKIGEIVEKKQGISITQIGGEKTPLENKGYDHFATRK